MKLFWKHGRGYFSILFVIVAAKLSAFYEDFIHDLWLSTAQSVVNFYLLLLSSQISTQPLV
jgi:hypothetical protein